MQDLGVFDAEAVVMVAEVGGCVGENGVEGSESKAIGEVSYRMDVDLEPCVVPLLVRPSEGVCLKRPSKGNGQRREYLLDEGFQSFIFKKHSPSMTRFI